MTVAAIFIVLSLALSGQWIAAKLGVTAAPALELSTARYAIASVVLVAACLITRTPLPLRQWRLVALAAVCGVLGFNTLAFVGLTFTPASDAALILPTTIPAAAAVFATIVGETLSARRIAGLAIASVGTLIVILGGQQSGEGTAMRAVGDVLELLGAASWAAALTVGAAVFRREGNVLGYVTLMVLIGTALIAPLGLLQEGYRDVPTWSTQTLLAASFLGIASTALAFVLFFWAVRRFGPGLAAMVAYLTPVTTLVLAFAILGERPELIQLVGGAVIVAGVRLASRRRTQAAMSPAPSIRA